MGHSSDFAAGDMHADVRDLRWSPVEKTIVRKAFNLALQEELQSVIQETKDRAARLQKAFELWDLEHYLTQRRNEIDRKYDFRYSMIPFVLGGLLQEGRISEDHLRGLREDKLTYIRKMATVGDSASFSKSGAKSGAKAHN